MFDNKNLELEIKLQSSLTFKALTLKTYYIIQNQVAEIQPMNNNNSIGF